MRTITRKSAPGVRNGKVRKKNRTALSPNVFRHEQERLVIQRMRPGKGYRHALTPTDVRRFVALIPDWEDVAAGIKAVILTPGGEPGFGCYYNASVITLDAWPRDESTLIPERKRWLVEAIGVELGELLIGCWEVTMTPEQVRCFLLMGTFLHELGHHVDRMSTRSKADPANGEPFAIAYEHRRQKELWESFCAEFGRP